MLKDKLVVICIIGAFVLMCFIMTMVINSKGHITKDFSPDMLNPIGKGIESSDSDQLIVSSSLVDVKYIHSGNVETSLSNVLNLKHPACLGINNEEVQVPIFAYLLHHEKYGYFLIDSGCEASYVDNGFGPMKGWLLPFVMPKTKLKLTDAIENQLSEDILKNFKAVFFTHLHFEHTSGLPALPDNLIYIAGKGERSYSIKGLLEVKHFKRNAIIYTLDFNKEISKEFPLGKAIDIFGDQSVWAIATPGHSKGHTSYLINRGDKPVLIAGDACILNKSLELGVGSGTSSADIEKAQKTLDKIGAFIKNNPNVEIWCGHDFPK